MGPRAGINKEITEGYELVKDKAESNHDPADKTTPYQTQGAVIAVIQF